MNALGNALSLYHEGKISKEEITKTAQEFEHYLKTGKEKQTK